MATLSRAVTSGFAANNPEEARFYREYTTRNGVMTFRHVNCAVKFRVLDSAGDLIEHFVYVAENVPLDFSWYTAAFRMAAWAAFKASKNVTET